MEKKIRNKVADSTHFRVVRSMFVDLARRENINIEEFDLYNLTVYEAEGIELRGHNVTTTNVYLNQTCFVTDNTYEVFEAPCKKNVKNSERGKFLVMTRNKSILDTGIYVDTYLLSIFNVGKDDVKIHCFGEYKLNNATTKNADFSKIRDGYACVDGGSHNCDAFKYFDGRQTRKTAFLIKSKKYEKPDTKDERIISSEPVKIYKKKKKK